MAATVFFFGVDKASQARRLDEFLAQDPGRDEYGDRSRYPSITCADGTVVSVQAGFNYYSTPREDHGPYTHVEILTPNGPGVRPPWSWNEYDDHYHDSSFKLFTQVPIGLVVEYLMEHGGF
jgi:hypothetical protein